MSLRELENVQSPTTAIHPGKDYEQVKKPTKYPPGDARSMSPKRNSRELELLETNIRKTLRKWVSLSLHCTIYFTSTSRVVTACSLRQADHIQLSLGALAQKIREVKVNHHQLEEDNMILRENLSRLSQTVADKDSSMLRGVVGPKEEKR